jgi:hypothetical protein
MRIIHFSKDNLIDETKSSNKPVINVIRAIFNSDDNDWVKRLISTSITLETVALDNNEKELFRYSQPLSIGAYITPYHKQPVLEINYTEKFQINISSERNRISYWKTTIVLTGIEFKENESLTVSIIESSHVQNRVDDWKNRIDNLYENITNWTSQKPNYSCKLGPQTAMFEDLMKTFEIPQQRVNTLDVLLNNKIILAFKPKGLWVIGANGRIDIISAKGSLTIVDVSEQFQEPQWQIYTADRKNKSVFNQEKFYQVLDSITK